jgi:hypothetical protein
VAADGQPKRVMLLGEDLWRSEGRVGLIANTCAHVARHDVRPQRGLRPALRLSWLEI